MCRDMFFCLQVWIKGNKMVPGNIHTQSCINKCLLQSTATIMLYTFLLNTGVLMLSFLAEGTAITQQGKAYSYMTILKCLIL